MQKKDKVKNKEQKIFHRVFLENLKKEYTIYIDDETGLKFKHKNDKYNLFIPYQYLGKVLNKTSLFYSKGKFSKGFKIFILILLILSLIQLEETRFLIIIILFIITGFYFLYDSFKTKLRLKILDPDENICKSLLLKFENENQKRIFARNVNEHCQYFLCEKNMFTLKRDTKIIEDLDKKLNLKELGINIYDEEENIEDKKVKNEKK